MFSSPELRASGVALMVSVALVLLSTPPITPARAAAQTDVPRRIKTASTALPPIERGTRQLAADLHARRGHGRSDDRSSPEPEGPAAASSPAVPGRVIVKFRSDVSSTSRASAAQSVGGRMASRPTHARFDVLEVSASGSADAEAIAREMSARPDVEFAQADYRMYPRLRPNDPLYVHQWNFPLINMEGAWDRSAGADPSIVIAVLDTGVAFTAATFELEAPAFRVGSVRYPALGRVTVPFAPAPDLASDQRFVAPKDLIWGDDDPVDLDGHGTHVAGTIGQLTNNGTGGAGVAFNARIMPVKVLAGEWDLIFGAPNSGTDATVAQGIAYAADNGARVINLSLGRDGPPSPVLEEALRYAVSRGAVVTIAAGNGFEEGNPDETPARYGPAIAGVITVGAIGRDGNRASYSAVKSYVEISAPGGDYRTHGNDGLIYQQMFDPDAAVLWPIASNLPPGQLRAPRYDVFAFVGIQGTSMAAPHVAGLAALIMHYGVNDPGAVEEAITRFALDRGTAGPDAEYGSGVINSVATLRGRGLGLSR
jgi:serine protease